MGRFMKCRVSSFGLLPAALLVGAASIGCQNEPTNPDEIELSGPVTALSGACPNLTFTIAAQKVVTQPAGSFDDGECEDVREGALLDVEGTVGADRVLVAREVELK